MRDGFDELEYQALAYSDLEKLNGARYLWFILSQGLPGGVSVATSKGEVRKKPVHVL